MKPISEKRTVVVIVAIWLVGLAMLFIALRLSEGIAIPGALAPSLYAVVVAVFLIGVASGAVFFGLHDTK